MDNGSISFGTTKDKSFPATWSTPIDSSFSNFALFRKNTTFVNPATDAFALATNDQFSAATLTADIGQPANVVCYGRFLLATYMYPSTIIIKQNTPIKLKLGKVTFQMRSN